MEYPIKPPLYALERDQLNDLLMADHIAPNIITWLRKIKHFPICQYNQDNTSTGLLLFERFTPNKDAWANDYTLKLFNFYRKLSTSSYYQSPWFNGYGLTSENFGDQLVNQETYGEDVPYSFKLENTSDNLIVVSFFQKSFWETNCYLDYITQNVEFYSKIQVRIPPKTSYLQLGDTILLGSLVVSGTENQNEDLLGVPPFLDYRNLDNYLEEILGIVDDNYPHLNKCLDTIDYEIKAACWNSNFVFPSNLPPYKNFYQLNYKEGSLILQAVPSWFYFASLVYGNNNNWGEVTEALTDEGKPIKLEINNNYLYYSVWGDIESEPYLTGDVVSIPLLTENNGQTVEQAESIFLTYKGETGRHYCTKGLSPQTYNENVNAWELVTNDRVRNPFGLPTDEGFYDWEERAYQSLIAFTNQAFIPDIERRLFSEYDGFSYALMSPLVYRYRVDNLDNPSSFYVWGMRITSYRNFFYGGTFDCESNNFSLSLVDQQSLSINRELSSYYIAEVGGLQYQETQYNQGEFEDTGFITGLFPSWFVRTHNAQFVSAKWDNQFKATLRSSPPQISQNITDNQLIEFVNNIIDPVYSDNEFMPDSLRIMEIHAALQADKFANDPNDDQYWRVANLGYLIERIARVLGISVDPDGSIRSIRQRASIESGETIPPGWPIGQWGRNQGGSDEGQKGGNETEDRDGITYPMISNKFGLDLYSGEPNQIKEGGYALCENLIQYLETFKDDLDKALGLQYSGANSFPLVQGSGTVSYEGLSVLVQENTYMISQLSRIISSAQISSLITQGIVIELMRHEGIPTIIKELKVDIGEKDPLSIPYPAFPDDAPSNFDHFLQLLMNLAPLLGGKIDIRKDLKKGKEK